MKKLLVLALLGLSAFNAMAEKADASKQATVDYDHATANQVNQTVTMSGNVVVTKGTLLLKAEKAIYKETDSGAQVTLNGDGKLATFRQKRDGGPDLWVEGEAQRIEYDERTSVMKLFGKAVIRQLEGARLTNETRSEYISYDSLREVFVSSNDPSGTSKAGGGRGRMIIAPSKPRPAAPAGATPAGAP
ncbi:MAG: lipopolysaccharide transport periplasmic protein LptA [Bdellovibrionales bacterium]|nr:lipopolysaccharide transport periplasmic protein LptA [Massilia sp.]